MSTDMMSDDRNNLHAVWQRSPWSNWHHSQTQCDENLGFEPHTEGHPRNDPTRDVDEKPSQGGNDAAHVLMTVVNSGISVKCYYIQ